MTGQSEIYEQKQKRTSDTHHMIANRSPLRSRLLSSFCHITLRSFQDLVNTLTQTSPLFSYYRYIFSVIFFFLCSLCFKRKQVFSLHYVYTLKTTQFFSLTYMLPCLHIYCIYLFLSDQILNLRKIKLFSYDDYWDIRKLERGYGLWSGSSLYAIHPIPHRMMMLCPHF